MNPTCREIEGLLSPYLDRELDPLVARRVDEHLSSCSACSDALAATREAGRILAAAVPLRSEAEWEALALRVEMAIDREEARVFQEAAAKELMAHEEAVQATPAMAMRTLREEPSKKAERSRPRGFGWWGYGSGAIAVAMLVLLLWPWFQEHVEEGPPAPPARAPTFDTRARHEEPAPSAVPEQEKLSAREPASSSLPAPAMNTKRNAASPTERDLASSGERAAAPSTTAGKDSEQPATGVLGESAAKKQFGTAAAPSPGAASPQSAAPPASSDEQAKLEKSAPSGSAPSVQKAVPNEERKAAAKEGATTPQPMSTSETSSVWRSDPSSNGFRAKTKATNGPIASDTPSPPPPMIKHFSETEWAEISELQTQEALKVGTEKSLAEATQVSESFLKEYPRSVFRTQAEANLLRTTAALVQLNPNIWCERAVAALDNWKLEKPSPAINLEAEITTIEGQCLK